MAKARLNPVLILGGLSVTSLLIFFQLYRQPETALLFLSLPSPAALLITAFIALVPVKKSVSSLFINHDKTCALRSSHM